MYHMKRATVRDLRYNFKKVERLLRAGENIEVTKRNKVIARLVPVSEKRPEMPDFMGRMRAMFGDKVFEPSNAELIAEDRERF
jgi:antitoxin (DNA-binding transcriptional repressor) of toxin-antitoxin stability system